MMKRKRWLAMMLSAAVIAASLPMAALPTVRAEGVVLREEPTLTTGAYDIDNDGVADSVYAIGTAAELEWFGEYVNGGHGNVNAVLTADIDLEAYTHTPIGTHLSAFTGKFDGRGHRIRNMSFSATGSNGENWGLFGVVDGVAVVRDFSVDGEIVLAAGAQKHIGGVAGKVASYATILNAHSYVNIHDNHTAYQDVSQVAAWSVV